MSNTRVILSGFDMADPTSTMSVVEEAVPTPGAGEVLVKLVLRPVNPADLFSLMGVYPGFQPGEGVVPVPGLEGTGVVQALGSGAGAFSVGQRVVGAPFSTVVRGVGTWQQYLAVPETCLVAVPDSVSDDTAAQFFVNPVTVYGMLEVLAVPAGEFLLQTGAGSVLGRQLIQLAKHRGIKTINVVRRGELAAELTALGADEVIVSTEEEVAARVKEITGGKGAYAAVECVGGDLFAQTAAAVRDGGTCIIYGAMGGLEASFGIPDLLFRGVTLRGFWVPVWADSLGEGRAATMGEVMRLLAEGVITPYSGKKFPLDQAVAAVAAATAAARGGKVLLQG